MKNAPIICTLALPLAITTTTTTLLFAGAGACRGGDRPVMAIFDACQKACADMQPMFELCLETMRGAPDHSEAIVYAAVAAEAALESCAATERAGDDLAKDTHVPDEVRAAYNNCMDKYGYARRGVAAVGDALALCELARLRQYCGGAVAAVDGCAQNLRAVAPWSPLYRMDLADRDRITLACSLENLAQV